MDISLDDRIKLSKNGTGANKNKQQRIPNRNKKYSGTMDAHLRYFKQVTFCEEYPRSNGLDREDNMEELELYKIKKDKLKNKVDTLQSKLDKKLVSEEHIHHVHAEICRL
ncbi:hypothetical protein Tco_1439788 [Tanacetum coccineum]